MRRAAFRCVLAAGALFGTLACVAATVHPVATQEALVNPGMGLVYYHNAGRLWAYGSKTENGDGLDWFPGVSTIYCRLLWSELEPAEGDYRWEILDSFAQPFVASGKQIAIRVICCNQTANACPDYVREAGAKGLWFTYSRPGFTGVPRWEPTYDDPVFLAKYEKFLAAFAARYDGNPNVAFVDIGSFGLYGEGHTGGTSKLGADETARIARLHMALHRRLLPNTYLVISDDVAESCYDAPDAPLMQEARRLGIGWRDDSIFCLGPKPGKFNPEGSWQHSGWGRLAAMETPVILEHGHWPMCTESGRWVTERMLPCIEDHQASYWGIHDFPDHYLATYRKEIDAINLRLGYRFELRQASWPDEVREGERVALSSDWVNVGVAPCHGGAFLAWSLVDARGRVVWTSVDETYDFKAAGPKLGGIEKKVSRLSSCRFGYVAVAPEPDVAFESAERAGLRPPKTWLMLKPGRYGLCVSLGTRDGTPKIALPLDGQVGATRRYRLGEMTVEGGLK